MDQGYQDFSNLKTGYKNNLELDNLPKDYFYSTDYDYLTLPEVQLLLTLSDSRISYSFSGLKKTTLLHQNQLTKALKRLMERDFLARRDNGTYELTNSGSDYTKGLIRDLISNKAINIQNNQFYSQWKKIHLIPPLESERIISALEKRWFGNFRFLFKRESKDVTELCWEDNENNRVHLYIDKRDQIGIEYRTTIPSYSKMEEALNWLRSEIIALDEVNIEIEDYEIVEDFNKEAYN
jgi:hypothetical protein